MTTYKPTQIPGIHVRASVEWDHLGKHLADTDSESQGAFLEGFAEEMHGMRHLGDMQLQFIANWINDAGNLCSKAEIKWLLTGIAERIED